MIFDKKLLFAYEQDIVAAGVVGDVLDLNSGDLDLDVGEQAFFGIVVNEDLAGATTCTFTIQTCDTEGGTYTDLVTSPAYPAAQVVNGAMFKLPIPDGCEQFVRIRTTATSVSAGQITAGIVAS